MSNDDRMGLGIVIIGVVFLLGMAGKGHVAWGGSWSGVGTAVGLLILAAIALAVLVRFTSRPSARRIGPVTRKVAARHEAGHAAVAKALGARKVHSWIRKDWTGDYYGYTGVSGWRGGGITPVEDYAWTVSGEYAAGTSAGCGSDRSVAAAIRSEVGWSQSGRVAGTGKSLARRLLSERSGEVIRIADHLERKGRW